MKQRSILFLFGAAALVLLSGCSLFKDAGKDEPLKVLMIGNSFSLCAMPHTPVVAKSLGLRLDLTSIAIGGCSMERHCDNIQKDHDKKFKPYLKSRNDEGKVTRGRANICETLRSEKWDVVTIQQVSHLSWKKESYHPFGDELVAKIRELAPTAKIYIQETWSYTPWDKRLKSWKIDQNEMFEKLRDAYADFARQHSLETIRMGSAVQQWRKRLPVKYTENSFGGDVVGGRRQAESDRFKRNVNNDWEPNSDVFHLADSGEYFQALVWVARLFDVDVRNCEYRPPFVPEEHAKLMKEIAFELK